MLLSISGSGLTGNHGGTRSNGLPVGADNLFGQKILHRHRAHRNITKTYPCNILRFLLLFFFQQKMKISLERL